MVLVTAVDLDNSILLALLLHTQILPPRYVITLNDKENWISYVCMCGSVVNLIKKDLSFSLCLSVIHKHNDIKTSKHINRYHIMRFEPFKT